MILLINYQKKDYSIYIWPLHRVNRQTEVFSKYFNDDLQVAELPFSNKVSSMRC